MTRRKPEPDTFRSIGEVSEKIVDRIAQKRVERRPVEADRPEVPGAEVEEARS